jgi:hypothetical protein
LEGGGIPATEQFDRIVLIHGLNGDPIRSWQSLKYHEQGPYVWLYDLPKEFPESRILTFGYDDVLDAAAETLLSDLTDDRTNNHIDVSESI